MIEKVLIFISITAFLYFAIGLVLVWRQVKYGGERSDNKEILCISTLYAFIIFSGLRNWVGNS